MNIIEDIKQRGPYSLAGDAETLSPDDHGSAGAQLLVGVRNAVVEAVEWRVENDGQTLAEAAEEVRDGDAIGEIADGAPSVYTHQLWLEFVDLGGYREDLEPHDLNGDDLNKVAGIALYHIAWRLASVLLDEIIENAEEN
ncbi:OCR-like antirestriction protein [Streptomyces phage Nanodon]|uniref:OCR-like antirestriction protein n=1 Tax=Streptomyces phage Nanodon TaxID=1873777 RepID=A0A1B1PA86_9CAUD|nr:OCR-like antirestriction protein [Streptomyces phage Nanodon]ANT41072.1 OCR-like antirestriction protein [Streptomyces phage Nanodon]